MAATVWTSIRYYNKQQKWFLPTINALQVSCILLSGVKRATTSTLANVCLEKNERMSRGTIGIVIWWCSIFTTVTSCPSTFVQFCSLVLFFVSAKVTQWERGCAVCFMLIRRRKTLHQLIFLQTQHICENDLVPRRAKRPSLPPPHMPFLTMQIFGWNIVCAYEIDIFVR